MWCEINEQICAAPTVMWSLYVAVKKELGRKAKLLIYRPIFVTTLTRGHVLTLMTKRKMFVHMADMSSLHRVTGTLFGMKLGDQ